MVLLLRFSALVELKKLLLLSHLRGLSAAFVVSNKAVNILFTEANNAFFAAGYL